jgi:hypothetical protein
MMVSNELENRSILVKSSLLEFFLEGPRKSRNKFRTVFRQDSNQVPSEYMSEDMPFTQNFWVAS